MYCPLYMRRGRMQWDPRVNIQRDVSIGSCRPIQRSIDSNNKVCARECYWPVDLGGDRVLEVKLLASRMGEKAWGSYQSAFRTKREQKQRPVSKHRLFVTILGFNVSHFGRLTDSCSWCFLLAYNRYSRTRYVFHFGEGHCKFFMLRSSCRRGNQRNGEPLGAKTNHSGDVPCCLWTDFRIVRSLLQDLAFLR